MLSAWESFYVIVGSSGAALVGLQFVVMALVADMRQRASHETIGAFGTPNVVHLAGALILSAIMSAPWPSLSALSVVLGVCGGGGLVYGAIVIRRARRQTLYKPVAEDWLWHLILPCTVYAALAAAALLLRARTALALFVIAGASLALLLIGIHNSWDTVTYMVAGSDGAAASAEDGKPDDNSVAEGKPEPAQVPTSPSTHGRTRRKGRR
jgi:hypothetical protein